jgi:tripartite-type tricarboxylate transporter receptor subunit TctC
MKTASLVLSLFIGVVAPASAQQDVADFYQGKTLRIVVGIAVGSGFDINARAIGRHISAHIPGRPTVIVQNQPGAGSLAMTNALYNNGPFDGTVIGASFSGMPTAPLLQPAGVRFDPVKLIWLGSSSRETIITYVWHTSPVQSLEDLARRELLVGAQAPGSAGYDYPMLANALFDFKFKVVPGYESTPRIHLAMERGELQGNVALWSTLKALNSDWVENRQVKLISQWALKRNPELPDVPMILDRAKNEPDRQALMLALVRMEFGRPFFLPPNVPSARVEALRRAFDATMKDKDFLAEAARLKLDIDPLTGEQFTALVEQVTHTPQETAVRVRAAMEGK